MKRLAFLATAAAALAIAAPASATVSLLFTFTGGYNGSFVLSRHPTPLLSNDTFVALDVANAFPNDPMGTRVLFYNQANNLGGLRIIGRSGATAPFDASGPLLFDGPTSDPYFNIGSYDLVGVNPAGNTHLEITITSVPEPVTWALMTGGFGLAGAALRRHAKFRYGAA